MNKHRLNYIILGITFLLLVNMISAAEWTYSLNEGLLGYWNFNNAEGNSSFPSLPKAVLTGTGSTSATGIIGTSWSLSSGNANWFIATNQSLPSSFNFSSNGKNGSTISFWRRQDNVCSSGCQAPHMFPYGSGNALYTYVNDLAGGTQYFGYKSGGGNVIDVGGILFNVNDWYMITRVWNGTGILTYINGTFFRDADVSASGTEDWSLQIVDFIGHPQGGVAYSIDEVGFWDRELSNNEITQLYNSGSGMTYIKYNLSSTLNLPLDSYVTSNYNVTFNCSVSDDIRVGSNLTLTLVIDGSDYLIINSSGGVSGGTGGDTIAGIFSDAEKDSIFLQKVVDFANEPLLLDKHTWTCRASNGLDANLSATSRTFYLNISTSTYNSTTIETSLENFNVNLSVSANYLSALGNLIYNGFSNAGSCSIIGLNVYCSKSIDIPLITGSQQNLGFYWNIILTNATASRTYNVSIQNQTVNMINFVLCNTTYSVKYLNLTFVDETTLLPMNASIDSSTWKYWVNSGTGNIYETYNFLNTSHHMNYSFCGYPTYSSINVTGSVQYSHSQSGTYPQRRIDWNAVYSNASVEKKLYLLDSNHGVSTTFLVISVGNQVISGASITIERIISGTGYTIVSSGTTDDAGQFTTWLSPNYDHRVTVVKSGYTTSVTTIRPTATTFTITLGTGTNWFYYNSSKEGITYTKSPASGTICVNKSTLQAFTYQVSSTKNNIVNCSFLFYRYNNTVLSQLFVGCNGSALNSGGSVSGSVNLTGITSWIGKFYVGLTSGETLTIEDDARWKNICINESNYGTSIISALNDSYYLAEWGDCPEGQYLNRTDDYCYDALTGERKELSGLTSDFSRIVFFFLFFAIILSGINFFVNYDTAYPGAFIYLMFGVVLLFSAFNGIGGPGFFYLKGATNQSFFGSWSSVIDNWILAAHFGMLTAIYFFTTQRRYSSG